MRLRLLFYAFLRGESACRVGAFYASTIIMASILISLFLTDEVKGPRRWERARR